MSIQLTNFPQQPADQVPELPHGLLTPSPRVQDAIARENARLRVILNAEVAPEAQKRFQEEMILKDNFERWPGIEVAYRSVPEGVEVLAVGFTEVTTLEKRLTLEERLTMKIREL